MFRTTNAAQTIMKQSTVLISAASKQATIRPTKPMFSGPNNLSVARPHALSGSAVNATSLPYSVSTINAVITQPIVQKRLMKLPVTSPTRASHSLLAVPPPVTMKCGVSTIPIMLIITIDTMAYSGNSLAALPPMMVNAPSPSCSCMRRKASINPSPSLPNLSTTADRPNGISTTESTMMQIP